MRAGTFLFVFAVSLFADSAGGLRWTAPSGWTNEGQAPMRAASYKMPLVSGDQGQAECVVYFFGQGQGGSVQANIERWKDQFQTESGKPAAPKIQMRVIHGLPVTTIDVSGKYSGLGGPLEQSSVVSGYRLLGAIIENPGGNIFVKFTGPSHTVSANQTAFEKLLDSFQRQ